MPSGGMPGNDNLRSVEPVLSGVIVDPVQCTTGILYGSWRKRLRCHPVFDVYSVHPEGQVRKHVQKRAFFRTFQPATTVEVDQRWFGHPSRANSDDIEAKLHVVSLTVNHIKGNVAFVLGNRGPFRDIVKLLTESCRG